MLNWCMFLEVLGINADVGSGNTRICMMCSMAQCIVTMFYECRTGFWVKLVGNSSLKKHFQQITVLNFTK